MPTPRRTPWVEVLVAALPAALHALFFLGRLHPDELFQSLEIAMNRTYGFGIVPWEWQVPPNAATATQPWGIRNWSVPLLFSGLFRLGDAVGISSVMGRRVLAEVPQFFLHAAMLGAVWRLAARRASAHLARWCLWLVALYAPLVWFGGRTMSESFSVAFLVWGLERLDSEEEGGLQWLLGGALLGFAQVTRYGSAAAILPAMAWLLIARRFKTFGLATVGGLLVAVALGLLDKLTWGAWFHSLIDYVRFNVVSGSAAASFGALPWWSYAARLLIAPFAVVGLSRVVREDRWRWPSLGVALVAGLLSAGLVFLGDRAPAALTPLAPALALLGLAALASLWLHPKGTPLFISAALGYLAIVSATAHKEDRFVYPVLVLVSVAGAAPFARWAAERQRRAFGAVIASLGIVFFVAPSPFDVQRKEQFQLVRKASEGATGLVLMNEGIWGSPGFFYLGQNIPWCPCDFPHEGCFQMAVRDARFNRGVYWSNGSEAEKPRDAQSEAAFVAAGFQLVERRGQASLFER
jgi:hypothetical protein